MANGLTKGPALGTPVSIDGVAGNLVVGTGWISNPDGSGSQIPVILIAFGSDGSVRAIPLDAASLSQSQIVRPA